MLAMPRHVRSRKETIPGPNAKCEIEIEIEIE